MAKKLTYAEIAEKLTQSYNKYDKQLQNAVTEAEKNSATRMLRRVSERMNGLVLENQEAANQQDMKKQAPNSPNLSIGTRTANGYAYGGITSPEYQSGGSVLNNKKLEKKYHIPTYDQFSQMHNIQPSDTIFFGHGGNKMEMVRDNLLDARVQKRMNEGQTNFNLPYMNQNFSMDNFIDFPSKKGKDPLKVYYETYPKDKLQGGGQPLPEVITEAQKQKLLELQSVYNAAKDNSTKSINARKAYYNFIKNELNYPLTNKKDGDLLKALKNYSPQTENEVKRNKAKERLTLENGYQQIVEPGGSLYGKTYPDGVYRSTFGGMPYDFEGTYGDTIGKGGKAFDPKQTAVDNADIDYRNTIPSTAPTSSGVSNNGLYDGVTPGDFEDLMTKARSISGIPNFDATNPEHVKALQTAMLNKSGEPSMFSGQEGDILNEGGSRSINNAGVDGKFGIDTLTALRQQGLITGTPKGITMPSVEPKADLSMPQIEGIDTPIMLDEVVVTGKKPGDGKFGEKLKGLGKNLPNQLAGISKMQEYAAHARAISDMQAPAPKNLEDPVYLNTQYNIAPQINAAEEQTALLARGLNANSTKRNNVRNNLAGLAAGNQRNFNQLYADKFNKESQLQNMQTMANAKANQLNNNIIFDNENALLDFNNQKRNAKADFASAITKDAMNLMTQRTNQRSQQAMLEALKPSWNKYGVMDRQYQDNGKNTELLKLLGLI